MDKGEVRGGAPSDQIGPERFHRHHREVYNGWCDSSRGKHRRNSGSSSGYASRQEFDQEREVS